MFNFLGKFVGVCKIFVELSCDIMSNLVVLMGFVEWWNMDIKIFYSVVYFKCNVIYLKWMGCLKLCKIVWILSMGNVCCCVFCWDNNVVKK